MIISRVKINSFRGLKNLEYDLANGLNVFSGANGIGKSTIVDSIMWVLCDETLVYGKQSADNRNSNDLKEVINVALELDNGMTLERKYWDCWSEDKDGNVKYSRTENQFYINGAKFKKEEYFSFLKTNLLGLDMNIDIPKDYNILRSLMDYNYFGSVDYKVARKFTEELLGLKSDLELLNEEKFAPIKIDMQVLKFDIPKCVNKYDNEYKQLDTLINDKTLTLKAYEKEFDSSAIDRYDELVVERAKLFSDNLQNNANYLHLNQLLEENQVNTREEEKNVLIAISKVKNEINDLMIKGNECDRKHNQLIMEKDRVEKELNSLLHYIENNKSTIKELKENKFVEVRCPECNYVLNQDDKEAFEQQNNEKIKEIKERIESLASSCNEAEERIEKINLEIEKNTNKKLEYYNEYKGKFVEVERLEKEQKENTKVKELLSERAKIKQELDQFVNDYNTKRTNKLNELTSEIDKLLIHLAFPEKIELLKEEIKNLKQKRAIVETNKDLVLDFKAMKLQMIKDNTNKVFPKLEIEILEENGNTGNFKEVCYAKLKGVEYKGVNDGHRKYVGIMLIEDIKRALGINGLPIIFDKFADVDDEMLKQIQMITNEQIITTKVSNDKEIKLN